jgi:hypothetical protein
VDQGKGNDRDGDENRNGLKSTTDQKASHNLSPRFLFDQYGTEKQMLLLDYASLCQPANCGPP